ncbi:carboxymuconolactone decarboxylase family protein [Corynebacterium dentalis]|uniref:carboxymuconolactone decarboxylase family protein n=1 Tax=Corynebacterium dentalis TaxID=2014528 RepID=UPI0028963AAE|nr:carboxymuconolactone decarboxylase family protein [Corynebacterium dentalis]
MIRHHCMESISLKQRFNAAMIALEAASRGLSTRERLMVQLHASQLNGCEFCINLHSQEASKKKIDVTPQNQREKLILRITTMGTKLEQFEDEVLDEALEALGKSTTADLIAAIATINAWNRVGRLSRK